MNSYCSSERCEPCGKCYDPIKYCEVYLGGECNHINTNVCNIDTCIIRSKNKAFMEALDEPNKSYKTR